MNAEKLPDAGPAILAVNHSAGLWPVLILTAAFERPVHCVVPSGSLNGFLKKIAVRALGITCFDSMHDNLQTALSTSLAMLRGRDIVAIFLRPLELREGRETAAVSLIARLVPNVSEQIGSPHQPAIFPTNWLGAAGIGDSELIYIGVPLTAPSSVKAFGAEESKLLAEAATDGSHKDVFALEMSEVEHFHRQLESLIREDLKEEWNERPDWKQSPDELELSGFVNHWIEEKGRIDPSCLVALRKTIDAYREARRRYFLGQFRVEAGMTADLSPFFVTLGWIESILGFPVALYGLVNHLPAGIILFVSGLLRKSPQRDPKVEWLLRAFVVLGCYTVQLLLIDYWLGRAAAGYYTLLLPVSGAYLWRYRWLFSHRTQTLLLKARLPIWAARLRQRRKDILTNFDHELRHYAQSLGMPC